MSRSAADPDLLDQYATSAGTADRELDRTVVCLRHAMHDFTATGSSGPAVPDVTGVLAGVSDDARHLTAFVGRVAAAFAAADTGSATGTVTATDRTLAAAGIGFATDEEARREATRLARKLAASEWWSEGGIGGLSTTDPDELDALIQQMARGQHDPAFSVTLLTALGPEGVVTLVAHLRQSALVRGHDAAASHGRGQVGVVAQLLTTGFATRLGGAGRRSPRLSDRWTAAFLEVDLPATSDPREVIPALVDYSLLVRMAELPAADVLQIVSRVVDVSYPLPLVEENGDDPFGSGYSSIEANVLFALAQHPDASRRWLGSQNASGPNYAAIISEGDGAHHGAYADAEQAVLHAGLLHPDAGRLPSGAPAEAVDDGTLLGDVEAFVGRHHSDVGAAAKRTLAAVAVHWMPGWVVTTTSTSESSTEHGADPVGASPLDELRIDFLETVMTDDEAASTAIAGAAAVTERLLQASATEADAVGRTDRVGSETAGFRNADLDAASLLALVVAANRNAVRANAERERRRLDQLHRFVSGTVGVGLAFIPGGGPAVVAAKGGASLVAPELVRRTVEATRDGDRAAGPPTAGFLDAVLVRRAYAEGRLGSAEAVLTRACQAKERRSAASPVPTEGCEAGDDFFASDGPHHGPRPIESYMAMTPDQRSAFDQWVLDLGGVTDPVLQRRVLEVNQRFLQRVDAWEGR